MLPVSDQKINENIFFLGQDGSPHGYTPSLTQAVKV